MKTTAEIFNRADLSKVSTEDMEQANVLMSDFIEMASKAYDTEVCMLKMKLELLLCEMVSQEVAEKTVAKFKNEDGTNGAHWSYDETTNVLNGKPYYTVDFYYAMNKVYSDYYSPKFELDDYVRMAGQYIDDKDADSNKIKHSILKMWS